MSTAQVLSNIDARALRVLVIIPTYNEVQNLAEIVVRTFTHSPHAHVLIVDDGSPDGTGGLAHQMATEDPRVHLIARTGKLGLGSAYLAGFQWGLARNYEVLVQMDADGSHPPEALPGMISTLTSASGDGVDPGLVIGSRWVRGGAVENWPPSRQLLSRGGNVYARIALGIRIKDATAGYRAYRAEVLQAIDFDTVNSHGYCFQVDLTLRTLGSGTSIIEVPITFRERERGESKMSRNIVLEAMIKVTIWGAARRAGQMRDFLRKTPRGSPLEQDKRKSSGIRLPF
ncbi:polyprenol monophosphomannose synthase [Cryobacterium sp. Hh11]|uniref:polyprenol monophosphomannose synthase n=1 Tax=Cryobacterium sp. Hh11 TaxID=2555868 RepID=UPI00106CD13A|nr:polyprenol monophosphomannose synthase [Cryobacterium sp. Hh11]TFD54767.1 polyprenol monophosphomannose synthase [Cryobacterium sp. Hh11]